MSSFEKFILKKRSFSFHFILGLFTGFLWNLIWLITLIYSKIEKSNLTKTPKDNNEENIKIDNNINTVVEEIRIPEATSPKLPKDYNIYEFNIAGVTFNGRQKYLKKIYEEYSGFIDILFSEYKYQGEPALKILYEDFEYDRNINIGNVPATEVNTVLSLKEKLIACTAHIDFFVNENDEDIYYGKVKIYYK